MTHMLQAQYSLEDATKVAIIVVPLDFCRRVSLAKSICYGIPVAIAFGA